MNLLVPPALIVDVAFDDIFVGILPDGVHVETTGPKIPSPEKFLGLRIPIEDMLGREALDDFRNGCRREHRNALKEEMYMVTVCSDLDEADFISLLNAQTHLPQCMLDGCGKGLFPVFHRTDEVVE